MSLPSVSRSTTVPLQVLISGRVQDSLTPGESPRSLPRVRLLLLEPTTSARQEYPLKVNVRPDGSFAIFGLPETAFPRLEETTYRLQLEVGAANYELATLDFDLGPIAAQPELVRYSLPLPGIPAMSVQMFTSGLPLNNLVITLQRRAVRLRGRVVELNDPAQGVEGAVLVVAEGPSTTTGSQGNFEFTEPMPLRIALPITVSATDFNDQTFAYELNYNQPFNSLLISLTRTPEPDE